MKRLDSDKPETPGKFVYKCSGWISLEVQRKHKNQILGVYPVFIWLFSSKMFSAFFFNTLIMYMYDEFLKQTCHLIKDINEHFTGKIDDYNKVVGWCIIIN